MPRCRHQNLVLIGSQGTKMRCRHCHLSIDAEELGDGFCPECYESQGVKRRDFEAVEPEDGGTARYCCEKCGAIITC